MLRFIPSTSMSADYLNAYVGLKIRDILVNISSLKENLSQNSLSNRKHSLAMMYMHLFKKCSYTTIVSFI